MTDIRTTNLAEAQRTVVRAAEVMVEAKNFRTRWTATKLLIQAVRLYQRARDAA